MNDMASTTLRKFPPFTPLLSVLSLLFISTVVYSSPFLRATDKSTINVSGLDVSLETTKFLEGMRDSSGIYSFGAPCKHSDCIPAGISLPQNPAWVTLAYVGLYKATGDPAYKTKIKESMDALRHTCPPDNLDCLYVGMQAAEAYELIGDDSYLDYLKNASAFYVHADPLVMLKAIMARELVLKLRYFGGDTQEVIRFVSDSEQYLKDSPRVAPSVDFRSGACWVQLAWLELARLPDDVLGAGVDDPQYPIYYRESILAFHPQKFFNENDFSVLLDGSSPDAFSLTLTELFPCVEALHILHNLTGDVKYLKDSRAIEELFLRDRWDSKLTPKFNGDGGFLAQGCVDTEKGKSCYLNNKVLNDNSYAVYLFADHKNLTYTIPVDVKVSYYSEPRLDADYPSLPKMTTLKQAPPKPSKPDYAAIIVLSILVLAFMVYLRRKKSGVSSE